MFEEYVSPESARAQLESIQWDMRKDSAEQFVASLRRLCRVAYPMMATIQQDQEAGMRLMSRIPTDIKSLVHVRVGPNDDIVPL